MWRLDTLGRTSTRPLIRLALLLLTLSTSSLAFNQPYTSDEELLRTTEHLFAQERWPEIVRSVGALREPSAELDYFYGIALAHVGRLDDAYEVLLSGCRGRPQDKRFPTELAGVEFRRNRYKQAIKWLRRALSLDPKDTYANDFLGSVYYLQGNIEASLKYWNRIDKPRIGAIRLDPQPRLNTILLDRAFAFSPASPLRLEELLATNNRLHGLQVFSTTAIELAARPDNSFDVVLHAAESNSWKQSKAAGLLSTFRGVFQRTIYPEYFNINGSAVNAAAMYRWDKQKRRVFGSLSGPIRSDAKRRFTLGFDMRNENWSLREPTKSLQEFSSLNMRRNSVSVGVASFSKARWNWSSEAELSYRSFRNVVLGPATRPALLAEGFQLKHKADLKYDLWRRPENRFVLASAISTETGRIWSSPSHSFLKLQGTLSGHWFPKSRGDDYEMTSSIRTGKTLGEPPLDELFILGVERDNDLWLRAHPGTMGGKKGSGLKGHNYFLSNWDLDKNLYTDGLVSLKVGPFLDSARLFGYSLATSPNKWMLDTGIQTKVRLLGIGVRLLYGKDLRSGRNTFYAAVVR